MVMWTFDLFRSGKCIPLPSLWAVGGIASPESILLQCQSIQHKISLRNLRIYVLPAFLDGFHQGLMVHPVFSAGAAPIWDYAISPS